MKWLLIIPLLCVQVLAHTQDDPASLAKQLTATAKTDREKITRIFHWITDNISYTVFPHPVVCDAPLIEEDDGPLLPLEERVAAAVIKRRTALCDGYARLFKTLCHYAGIPSEIIEGYARSNGTRGGSRFAVNHFWNAVLFEGEWHLLDATWASGYVNGNGNGTEFIRDYDGNYFLTDPRSFGKDHFPDNPRWALLHEPLIPEEFRDSPFRQRSFGKYEIISFYPGAGIIEASLGDTVYLLLKTKPEQEKKIAPGLSDDLLPIDPYPGAVFLFPGEADDADAANGVWRYRYVVRSTELRWLFLFYNGEPVLTYRVHVCARKNT